MDSNHRFRATDLRSRPNLGLLLATPLVAAALVIVRMVYIEDVLGISPQPKPGLSGMHPSLVSRDRRAGFAPLAVLYITAEFADRAWNLPKNRELTNCGSWSSARADSSIGRLAKGNAYKVHCAEKEYAPRRNGVGIVRKWSSCQARSGRTFADKRGAMVQGQVARQRWSVLS